MKNLTLVLLSLTFMFSCKKDSEEPLVDTDPSDSLPSSFTKRVLLEDYTKHCRFCIPLNAVVDSMKNHYPNNSLIPVLISTNHSTQISYFDSIETVFNFSAFPSGSVNRVPAVNSGAQTGNLIYVKDYWGANVDSELLKSTDQGITIKSSLTGDVIDFTVAVGSFKNNSDLKLSVFIIEDDTYYRTLRRVITDYRGRSLDLKANDIGKHTFMSVNLAGYNIPKMSIVAFVHYFNETTQNFEVVNVNEVKAGENVSW